MFKHLIIILSISIVTRLMPDTIDELEILINHYEKFEFIPEQLNKVDGEWCFGTNNQPYTGRLEVYSISNEKIIDCTIINGKKNGYFIQYYDHKRMLPGIMGMYVDNKKDGLWKWIMPEKTFKNRWLESDLKIISSIEYREGIKHGNFTIQKTFLQQDEYLKEIPIINYELIVKGYYNSGKRNGEWFFNDHIHSDYDWYIEPKMENNNSFYWSRKLVYDNSVIINSICREPWNSIIDCDNYNNRYMDYIFYIPLEYGTQTKKRKTNSSNHYNSHTIKDMDGNDVELNLDIFLKHINQYHDEISSIHEQDGHRFIIDEVFRKSLMKKMNSRN
ncbi:MAG: hypothetical protein CMG60_02745 [Candidatus Marinimicrobia bacterium]|nr:hypothetical protein [Candidatus Neomarinimicrobiota bacterium]